MSNSCRAGTAASFDRNWSDSSGTTVIEFALLAPVFLMLVFGIIVYGLFFATDIAITYAASEAARASEAGLSDSERESIANSTAQAIIQNYSPLLALSSVTITSGPVTGNGGLFQVSITYNFQSFGLEGLSRLLPIPTVNPSANVVVSHGGY